MKYKSYFKIFIALFAVSFLIVKMIIDVNISGYAKTIDGDTIEIENTRIRLWGVQAPELYKDGGIDSSRYLSKLIRGKEINCKFRGRSYDRRVALCYLNGKDLAEIMVSDGYAVDWPDYSGGEYWEQTQVAKKERRGLWTPGYLKIINY